MRLVLTGIDELIRRLQARSAIPVRYLHSRSWTSRSWEIEEERASLIPSKYFPVIPSTRGEVAR